MRRQELTLEQKISMITDNDRGSGFLILKLAEKYEISKSGVANILTRSAEYQDDYSFNVNKTQSDKIKKNA